MINTSIVSSDITYTEQTKIGYIIQPGYIIQLKTFTLKRTINKLSTYTANNETIQNHEIKKHKAAAYVFRNLVKYNVFIPVIKLFRYH